MDLVVDVVLHVSLDVRSVVRERLAEENSAVVLGAESQDGDHAPCS